VSTHWVGRATAILIFGTASLHGAFFSYVGQLGPTSALIAWGEINSFGNSIGRASTPIGNASVKIDGRSIPATQNWVVIDGLKPDQVYPYEVDINNAKRAEGSLRTWEAQSQHFCFFSIGDFGTGHPAQYRVADAMMKEFDRRQQTGCPVRFVITVGDNIYADVRLGSAAALRSGDLDVHWESKFFAPYAALLHQVPFLPTLGNHDGNANENRGDLNAYLDNFFFPNNVPARFYTFIYGGFAQFFALDSTLNTLVGPPAPQWAAGTPQDQWLRSTLPASTATWKIPYYHHPMYDAGPEHNPSYKDLKDWAELFEKSGVRVVLSGHEHNFQFSKRDETGGILYVVSGSGGELHAGKVRKTMAREHIAGWAPVHEFLSIEVDGPEMRITPVSPDAFQVIDPEGKPVSLPITATAK
jgi:hypothetical protein